MVGLPETHRRSLPHNHIYTDIFPRHQHPGQVPVAGLKHKIQSSRINKEQKLGQGCPCCPKYCGTFGSLCPRSNSTKSCCPRGALRDATPSMTAGVGREPNVPQAAKGSPLSKPVWTKEKPRPCLTLALCSPDPFTPQQAMDCRAGPSTAK